MAQAAEGLRAMRSMNIGGIEVRASYAKPYTAQTPRRTRGAEGRQELADKGHLGNGPDAGITSAMRGRTVVIDGLPLRRTAEEFLRKLSTTHGMHLRPSTGDVDMTYLQVPPGQWQNRTSRYLVVMKDAVEAHRIVRELHWTEHAFDDRTYTLTLHIVH
ncbi:hypothetical protein DL96DRAFT_1071104 [Flagelloscypha sp. PMI_526]|nr:hypothetical protein DL96DRAFT_1071104 [Flagelloscypha sp. PMI_526]